MSEKLKDKRNFLDGLITSSERSGEGFQGIMDRLVGVKGEKTNLYNQNKSITELLGHLALSKDGLDPEKYGTLQKIVEGQYPSMEELNNILDPNDPKFGDKLNKINQFVSEDEYGKLVSDVMSDGQEIPRSIIVSPNKNKLAMQGVGLHEARHAVDDTLGIKSQLVNPDLEDLINEKGYDPQSDMNRAARGHHGTDKMYETGMAKKIYEGTPDLNKKQSKMSLEALKKVAGNKLRSIPVVGAAIGAGVGLMADDAAAGVPILGEAENAGMSKSSEDQMMAEIQAKKDYGTSNAASDRLAALKKLRGE